MTDIYDVSEYDEVAATVPSGYLKGITNHRDAVLVAKRFCVLGAGSTEIDNLATAILARTKET